MRTVHCYHCSSADVIFKGDIHVGCCGHKSGEVWHCNNCGEDMVIQIVYTDESIEVDCPHETGTGGCGTCKECEQKN